MSGFTGSGRPEAVPAALTRRAVDGIDLRMPYQPDPVKAGPRSSVGRGPSEIIRRAMNPRLESGLIVSETVGQGRRP